MKPGTFFRVVKDCYLSSGPKKTYWKAATLLGESTRLLRKANRPLLAHVLRDQARFLAGAVRPIENEAPERIRAAVAWLLRAQEMTPDDGVSLGYFPCDPNSMPWRQSYPETTGYIITSLLAYAARYRDDAARRAALKMSRWEIDVQMPSGAVQGGPICPPRQQTPAAFNTGMVLDGWCSTYAVDSDPAVFMAARRAADFLVNDLDADGYFRTNGAFVRGDETKTYTCLCAWAIHRFGDIRNEERYRHAAVRCIEAALRQQTANGWFAHNCLVRSDAPLTHTIGYTLQGILEVGVLAERADFLVAVRRAVDQILPHIRVNGYLPGLFYSDWEPAQFSSCLTGSAQISIVLFRLFEQTGAERYREAANRLVNYLKALQSVDSALPDINGALAGSFPLFGQYMRAGYPNWATKYLLDALMLQDRLRGANDRTAPALKIRAQSADKIPT